MIEKIMQGLDRYSTKAELPFKRVGAKTAIQRMQSWDSGTPRKCVCCKKLKGKERSPNVTVEVNGGHFHYNLCELCWLKWRGLGATCSCCGFVGDGNTTMWQPFDHKSDWFCGRCHERKKKYKITYQELSNLLQITTCQVCQKEGLVHFKHLLNGLPDSHSACIDHDHTTGKVRGILCTTCNKLEGMLRKSPLTPQELVNNMDAYLNE